MGEARIYPYNDSKSRFSVGLEGDWVVLRSDTHGGSSRWNSLGLDQVIDLARFLVACAEKMPKGNPRGEFSCSFCGKSQDKVKKLIAGPTVFICCECVDLCAGLVKEEASDGV